MTLDTQPDRFDSTLAPVSKQIQDTSLDDILERRSDTSGDHAETCVPDAPKSEPAPTTTFEGFGSFL
jgi:hypothetical protein